MYRVELLDQENVKICGHRIKELLEFLVRRRQWCIGGEREITQWVRRVVDLEPTPLNVRVCGGRGEKPWGSALKTKTVQEISIGIQYTTFRRPATVKLI